MSDAHADIGGDRQTIVIVEDNYLIAEDLRGMCEEFGAEVLDVVYASDPALDSILEHRPDFVLMDVRLGGKRDGVDVALAVYQEAPETRVIFITGSNEPPTVDRINSDHPYRILIKPISPGDLRAALGF